MRVLGRRASIISHVPLFPGPLSLNGASDLTVKHVNYRVNVPHELRNRSISDSLSGLSSTIMILRPALLGFAFLSLLQVFGLVSASGDSSLAALIERSRIRRDTVHSLARRGPRVRNRK